VTTLRDLIASGRTIHARLVRARESMEVRTRSGLTADWEHLPPDHRVGPEVLPEWYLRSFRTLLATFGKDSDALRSWNDFLREAREQRADLDLGNPLDVVRAGADDLARAIELLGRLESGSGHRTRGRPTITVGPGRP
jgi:hypothetical protein